MAFPVRVVSFLPFPSPPRQCIPTLFLSNLLSGTFYFQVENMWTAYNTPFSNINPAFLFSFK